MWYACCACCSRCGRRYKNFDDQVARWDAGVSAAPRPAWLPLQGKGNRDQPVENWAMSLRQLNRIVDEFDATRCFWELKARNDPRKEGRRYVNLYDINKHFVIPWTKGTGNSIALLMNSESPLPAQLMISHAWAEDVEEFLVALNSFFREHNLDRNVAIWVCTFAQYQANDGPTVAEQVAREPFKTVIHSPSVRTLGMCVVHTTCCEVYQRLWCVHEIDEALGLGLEVRPGFSPEYLSDNLMQTVANTLKLDTANAKCGCPEDEEAIKKVVNDKQGGFKRLDDVVGKFRMEKVVNEFANFKSFNFATRAVVGQSVGVDFANELKKEKAAMTEDDSEAPPIISAAKAGQTDKVKELLADSADVNVRDKKERTALMYAGDLGNLACVQLLIAANADLQAKDAIGETVLTLTATPETGQSKEQAVRKMEALLGAGADMNHGTNQGRTALMGAALSGNPAIVKLLLAAKADMTARDNEERTALDLAQMRRCKECEHILEEAARDGLLLPTQCEPGDELAPAAPLPVAAPGAPAP